MTDSGAGDGRMQIPSAELDSLSGIERRALLFSRWLNASPLHPLCHWINTQVHRRWILWLATSRRLHTIGLERLIETPHDRGVLIASNHRSFFDQFFIACCLYQATRRWPRFYFPVRSEFFYDHPIGVFLNAVVTSATMFPPIFRPRAKRGVTRAGLDFLADELRSPDTLVGIHPEGTRGKGPDPYELLPAEPGFGKVVLQSRPVVVPVFIQGLSNDCFREIASNISGRNPVIIVFGEPVDLSDFDDEDPRLLRNQVKVGRRVLADVAQLAEQEKLLRQKLK
jgi:1-acyl-sn-glycerol-3-phosphate acyltransferase